MKAQNVESAPETSLTQDVVAAARYWLGFLHQRMGGRRGLIAVTALAVGLGLTLNWSWLVAVGIAPLLVTALPCIAMCALGLCMNRGTGRPHTSSTNSKSLGNGSGDESPAVSHAEFPESPPALPTDEHEDSVVPKTVTAIQPQPSEKRSTPDE